MFQILHVARSACLSMLSANTPNNGGSYLRAIQNDISKRMCLDYINLLEKRNPSERDDDDDDHEPCCVPPPPCAPDCPPPCDPDTDDYCMPICPPPEECEVDDTCLPMCPPPCNPDEEDCDYTKSVTHARSETRMLLDILHKLRQN